MADEDEGASGMAPRENCAVAKDPALSRSIPTEELQLRHSFPLLCSGGPGLVLELTSPELLPPAPPRLTAMLKGLVGVVGTSRDREGSPR